MTWFKVDDTLAFHAKVVSSGNAAMGLWVRAGSWSAQQLTDGFIPDHMIPALGNRAQANALTRSGLWVPAAGGFEFHQWSDDDRQPTREDVEKKRHEWREKKRSQRRNGSGKYESVPDLSPEESPGDMFETPPGSPAVPSRPVPTRPVLGVLRAVWDGPDSSSSSPKVMRGESA